MAFCPNCGREVSPQAVTCPNCGQPLNKPQVQGAPIQKMEKVSAAWWLLPFFLTWIGGLIAYFVLKDRNAKTARNMLIFGIVWAFVGIIFLIALAGFIFGLFSPV